MTTRICLSIHNLRTLASRIHRGLQADEGATLFETAVACVVLFAVLLGVFEFSLAFYTYHYASNAARQGSRYAIVRGSACQTDLPLAPASFHCNASRDDIANYVKGIGYPGIDPANMDVAVSTCAGNLHTGSDGKPTTNWPTCDGAGTSYNNPGDQVQVKVTYHFPLAIPFWKYEKVGIGSTSSMVYSQ